MRDLPDRIRNKINLSSYSIKIIIASIIGIAGGSFAVFYRLLIGAVKQMIGYKFFLAPAMGAFFAGLVIYFGSRNARGHGIPVVIESVNLHGGKMTPGGLLTEGIASALTIGSGGSAGRVGPIVEIGAGIGSLIGQALKVQENYLKTFLACGAASGLAAIFNAPVAGVFFSLEVLLGELKTRHLSLIIISALTADVIARGVFGDRPAFLLPAVERIGNYELIFFAILGLITAVSGQFFIRVFYFADEWFKKIPLKEFFKPVFGGLLVGILGINFPEILGVGFNAIESMLEGRIGLLTMLIIFFIKILATALTLGSGASGGVFAPLLFVGAAIGGTTGMILSLLFPGKIAFLAAYVLAGMGGVIAGAIDAPVFAVILIFEMTRNYVLVLPLLLTCVISGIVSHKISPYNIYTRKLKQKGIDIEKINK